MRAKTVKARKVREGDFITGLDNAYVFKDPERIEGEEAVLVMFHDVHGNEGSLECWSGMLIDVERA